MAGPNYQEMNARLKKVDAREELAAQTGMDEDEIDDKTLKGVNSALRGGAVVAAKGADPVKVPLDQLKAADPAANDKEEPEKETEEDKSKQQKLMMALAASLPTLLGYAFGGASGGAAGAQAGTQAVSGIAQGIQAEETEKQRRSEKAAEIGVKKADVQKDLLKLSQEKELKTKEIDTNLKMKGLDREIAKTNVGVSRETELRKEYLANPMTKRTQEISESLSRMQQVSAKPSAAGDISLIYNFMRMNDPSSTVREGEFATAQNAGGIPERLRSAYNKAVNGERLSDDIRSDFLDQGSKLATAQLQKQEAFDGSFRQIAGRYGIDPENVILNFGQPTSQSLAKGPAPKGPGGGGLPGGKTANAAPPVFIPSDQDLEKMSDEELRRYLGKGN